MVPGTEEFRRLGALKAGERRAKIKRDPVLLSKYQEQRRAFSTRHADAIRQYQRLRHARRRYGLTPDGYRRKLGRQMGLCAICFKPMTKPVVDHDHSTSKIRDFLCQSCNIGIAVLERKGYGWLRSAFSYLRNHSSVIPK